MTSAGKHFENIIQRLTAFEANVKRCSQLGRTNINKDAERLFCYPLGLLFDGEFINLNTIEPNYPAVDLGCTDKRICVQVTSDNDHEKIQSTLDKFFFHSKDQSFDRLIVLIIGDRKNYKNKNDTKDTKYPPFTLNGILNFDADRDIWGTKQLLEKIDKLPEKKLEQLSDFLDTQLESTGAMRPYLYLPPPSSLGDRFIGRKSEMETIRQQLETGMKPVVLWGLGGMGKTQLASEYARKHRDGIVYFAHFRGSLRDTVIGMYSGVYPQSDQPADADGQFNTVMNLLMNCTEKDLLIIDNVDASSGTIAGVITGQDYEALYNMKLRLILTTRFECRGAVEIKPLENSELKQIFRKHDAPVSEAEMDALIAAVSGHTMAVDLIARTLADNWVPVSPDDILYAIQHNTLAEADFAEIDADYGNFFEQKQIYQHLRAVFNVAKIPPTESIILHYATLLPDNGMDLRLFYSCLNHKQKKTYAQLGRRGWLLSDGKLLRIHPIIRMICRAELNPTSSSCGGFLDALAERCMNTSLDFSTYYQVSEVFAEASQQFPDQKQKYSGYFNSSVYRMTISSFGDKEETEGSLNGSTSYSGADQALKTYKNSQTDIFNDAQTIKDMNNIDNDKFVIVGLSTPKYKENIVRDYEESTYFEKREAGIDLQKAKSATLKHLLSGKSKLPPDQQEKLMEVLETQVSDFEQLRDILLYIKQADGIK